MPEPKEQTEYSQYLELIGANDNQPAIKNLAVQDTEQVFYNADGARTEKGIAREVAVYQEVIHAKVSQLMGNQLFSERQAKTREDFNKSPRTRAKTAQELLSADTELQAFTREDVANHGEAALIQSVVVDPRRVTDTMLRDFGLDEYIPTGKKLSGPARLKMRADAIPAVKGFITNGIEPLDYRHEELRKPEDKSYFRLFRITQGKNEGLILGTQENEGERPFLTDIHSAFRRVDHIQDSYKQEMEKLHRIQQGLNRISGRVSAAWNEVRDGAEFDEMKKELCEMVESLQFVKNPHKLKMKKSIERCLTFKDKKARLNPSSRLAILAPVKEFISKRIDEGGRILSYLTKDRVRVQNVIMGQAGVLADFHEDVERYNDKLVLLQPEKEITPVNKQRVVTNLTAIKNQCASFQFEPYLKLAKYVIGEIDKIIAVLNSEKTNDPESRERSKKSFVMVYVVSKLLKLEIDLMALRDEFFKPGQKLENVYVKAVIERLQEIHAGFQGKKVAPEVEIKGFGKLFGQVYELLGESKNIAQQSLADGAPKEKRVEALGKINDMLKAFNPYERLQEQSNDSQSQTTSTE